MKPSVRFGGIVILIDDLIQEGIDSKKTDKIWIVLRHYFYQLSADHEIKYIPNNGIHAITLKHAPVSQTKTILGNINRILNMKSKELDEVINSWNQS